MLVSVHLEMLGLLRRDELLLIRLRSWDGFLLGMLSHKSKEMMDVPVHLSELRGQG